MTGLQARTIESLRAIPSYRNDRVLLDTKQVKTLVDQERALFVDVRYPGEFAAERLPGAINLPIRRIAREELEARIAQLPKQPIILPCYDRRSCFFSEVLGLELAKAGHDFRGRYTLPWEFFNTEDRPAHEVEWDARATGSAWTRVVASFSHGIHWLAERAGLTPGR
jgi:hypothetical protein